MIEKLEELPSMIDSGWASSVNWGATHVDDYNGFAVAVYNTMAELIKKNNELIDEVNRLKAIVGE